MRVLTFARHYPAYHPKRGEPTHFVEKIWKGLKISADYSIYTNVPRQMKNGEWQIPVMWRDDMMNPEFTPKLHTIRAGHRWKAGDMFSPRVWSGKPYRSKQIEFAPPMQVKRTYDFAILDDEWWLDKKLLSPDLLQTIATNDGLTLPDFISWFKWPKEFSGQVIIWDEKLKY